MNLSPPYGPDVLYTINACLTRPILNTDTSVLFNLKSHIPAQCIPTRVHEYIINYILFSYLLLISTKWHG